MAEEKSYYTDLILIIGLVFIVMMMAGMILFIMVIQQKRKLRYNQETMKSSFEKELYQSQLEIQSQAFESISRELHDNVGTLISIAMVHIGSVLAPIKEKEKISEAEGLLNEAMSSLRDISKSIHPENISQLGWQQSFIKELERIQKTKLFTVHYTEKGEPFPIDINKQVIIFRILQESLNNVVKHSDGDAIEASVNFTGKTVAIILKDNGKGISDQGNTSEGSGLRNMQARASMLPANLIIVPAEPNGTSLSLFYSEEAK